MNCTLRKKKRGTELSDTYYIVQLRYINVHINIFIFIYVMQSSPWAKGF